MKRDKKIQLVFATALILAVMSVWMTPTIAADVTRMSKEDLKAKLDDPNVVIVDVRSGSDWKSSEFKIKGAVREDSGNVDSWAAKYSTDKTLVLYCA